MIDETEPTFAGGSLFIPGATLVVGDGAHNASDTLAEALVKLGEVVRSLHLCKRASSVPMTASRVTERLRHELSCGRHVPSHILVSVDAKHALVVAEGLLRLQMCGRLRVDGVVMAVDGPTASTRLLTDQSVVSESSVQALAIADRIIVGRANLLTTEGLDGVAWALRNGNRLGPISFPAIAGIDVGAITNIDAWTGELRVGQVGADDGEACVAWQCSAPLLATVADAVRVVQEMLLCCSGQMLRLQGRLPVVGGGSVLVSGSGSTALTVPSEFPGDEQTGLTIVVPTEYCDRMKAALRSILARSIGSGSLDDWG